MNLDLASIDFEFKGLTNSKQILNLFISVEFKTLACLVISLTVLLNSIKTG